MGVSIVVVALLAQPMSAPAPNSATEAQGPPGASPLVRQSGPAVAGPAARPPSIAALPAPTAASPPPAPAPEQPQAGVIAYPAAFFAPAQPNTARDMISRLPGFSFDDGAGVRGFEGAAGNVLIDGQLPTSKSDDVDAVLRRIPAGQVDRIDLIRGGAPGVDMHGKALIANVVRKTGPASTALIGISDQWITSDGRHAPALRLEGTRRRDGTALEGSLVVSSYVDDGEGDGPRTLRDATGARLGRARDDTRAGGDQATATGAYEQPLMGGKLRINASLTGQTYIGDELVDGSGSAAIAASRERDHQNTESSELGLRYTRDFGTETSLEALAIQQVNGEDYLSLYSTPGEDDRFRERHLGTETIGRAVLTWRGDRRLTIEAGGETAYNTLDSHTHFASNGADLVLPAANVKVDELRGEAFAKATWAVAAKLNVEVGLRVEVSRIQSAGDVVLGKVLTFPKPRLSLAWSPTGSDQFRLRIEEEVGQLDFSDFVASSSLSTGQILAGNPDLTPQQALVVEGAWERRFLKDASASITLRHAHLTDVIDRAPVLSVSGSYDAPANIGGGSKDEAVLNLSLPLKRFGVTGGLFKTDLTWRRSEVSDPTTGSRRPISGLRPFEGKISFSQDVTHSHLTWGGDLNVGWRQRYFRFNQVETDTLSPLGDLFVEVRPRPGWAVRAELQDVGLSFDRKLLNWAALRGGPYATQEDRDLAFGPMAYVRVRRSW